MAALKESAKKVFYCVKEHTQNGDNITAADIAAETDLEVKSVNGIVTAAFQRKGLMKRTPAEIELDDKTHKAVKFISLTEDGMAFNPEQTDAE